MSYLRLSFIKILVAFLLSPLMLPLTIFAVREFRHRSEFTFENFIFTFIIFAPFSYVLTAGFAMPVFYIFKMFRLKNVFAFILCGGIVGFIGAYFFGKIFPIPMKTQEFIDLYDNLMYCVGGIFTGLCFWIILYGFRFNQFSLTELK